jgi:ABC-2 type transport system permease protein
MFFALLVYYAGNIGVVLVILGKFNTIAGWSLGEIAFLYGLMVFSQGLTTVFFGSMNDFETMVVNGEFDRLLVRPLDPLGQILSSKFEIISMAHFFIGITAIYFGSSYAGVEWTLAKFIFLPTVLFGAVLIQGGIRLAVSAVCFWTVRNRSLVHTVVYSSKEMILYPVTIYKMWMQVFLTLIFPIAFVNFYPSHYFLSRDGSTLLFHPVIQYLTPVAGMIVFALAYLLWRIGINHYQSVGN